MQIIRKDVTIANNPVTIEVANFDKNDALNFKRLFDIWLELNKGLSKYGRTVNIPEVISEGMFCIFSGSSRYQKKIKGKGSASFDTLDLKTGRTEQIKASSIAEDLSSFGPKSEWDDLYFMSFNNGGQMDGSFDVYKIPAELIYSQKVNKGQSFKDQQAQGKRPRFSIMKDIIKAHDIKPIGKNVKVWEL